MRLRAYRRKTHISISLCCLCCASVCGDRLDIDFLDSIIVGCLSMNLLASELTSLLPARNANILTVLLFPHIDIN